MTRYAVLVGVGKYEDSQISELRYADRDVANVKEALIECLGFEEENVFTYTHESGEWCAENTRVLRCLAQLSRITEPDDTLLFYFAGHGVEKEDGVYLLTVNSNMFSPSLLRMSSIPISVLREDLSGALACNRVFIVDACRNDPERGRGDSDNLLSDTMSRDIVLAARSGKNLSGHEATGVLFACRKGERAYEWEEKRQGVFSYHLVDGIRKLSAAGGTVGLSELEKYVKNGVSDWCLRNLGPGRRQTPWLVVEGSVPDLGAAIRRQPAKPVFHEPEEHPATYSVFLNPKNAAADYFLDDVPANDRILSGILPLGDHVVKVIPKSYRYGVRSVPIHVKTAKGASITVNLRSVLHWRPSVSFLIQMSFGLAAAAAAWVLAPYHASALHYHSITGGIFSGIVPWVVYACLLCLPASLIRKQHFLPVFLLSWAAVTGSGILAVLMADTLTQISPKAVFACWALGMALFTGLFTSILPWSTKSYADRD
jgi:hypothetical protein